VLRATSFLSALAIVLSAAPAGAQDGTGLPWTSSFESGDFREWNRGPRNVTVVTTDAPDGTRAARAALVAGTQNPTTYAEHVFGDWYSLPSPKTKVEEVYLRFYSRFSSGYQWPNTGQKVVIFNLMNGVDGDRRYQVYISINSDGTYRVDHSYIDTWQFFGLSQNVGSAVRARFDQWDKLKLYVRLNSPGQSNGIVRLWVNDVLKLEYTNRNIRQSTSYGLSKLILSAWSTDESPVNGVQWWDHWTMSRTDPDAGNPSTPAAPTNVRIIR
jgi:hypothetical protein